ncbi:hypothetical protein, partial [Legionella sp.]
MGYMYQVGSVIFFILALTNPVLGAADKPNNACQVLHASKQVKKILGHTSQIIVVKSLGGMKAEMSLCQRRGAWVPVFSSPFRAVIGKKGIASIGKKEEGDLKTPAGLYPIGEAFGTQPLALKMDYKYITADDKFIDDVNSSHYNSWVNGTTAAKSYETMLIEL